MSEEAEVGIADEALELSYQSGKKMESRDDKGSVEISELDGDVYRDSSVRYRQFGLILRPIGILSMHSCSATLSFVCYLRPATLAFVSFFVFAILMPGPLLEIELRKYSLSALSALRNTRVFGDSRVNFTTKVIEGKQNRELSQPCEGTETARSRSFIFQL